MDAQNTPALGDCVFYHSMDLPGLGSVEGQWDLRGRFDDYVGGVEVKGKTFLDVGAASGFLSFEAERRGASVISFDALDHTQYQLVPPAQSDAHFFRALCAGYELAHRSFNSNARCIRGSVYSLSKMRCRPGGPDSRASARSVRGARTSGTMQFGLPCCRGRRLPF